MADHARKQIRTAIATALTGLVTTGANVKASRTYTVPDGNLPHLSVYTREENLEPDKGVMGDKEFRLLEVTVEARAKKVDAVDDQLDQIAKEVEVVLAGNQLSLGVKDTSLISTSFDYGEDDAQGEKPHALMTMIWQVEYRVDRTAPDVIIA